MAFTSQGTDIAVTTNPATGKLRRVWDTTGSNKGNPRFDSTEAHAVYISVFCRRAQYWGDPTGTLGSLAYTVFSNPKITPAALVSYVNDGLSPLVRGIPQRIVNPQVFAQRMLDVMNLTVTYQTPDGEQQTVTSSLRVV